MSSGKRFLLDANVFIQAHQSHYAFDICPGFWIAILRHHMAKRVFSLDRVRNELFGKRRKGDGLEPIEKDLLSDWVETTAPKTLFRKTEDKEVFDQFKILANWVQHEKQFSSNAKAGFSRVADGWIVAYARVNKMVVVTHELYAPDVKKKVPIPNICRVFEVQCCNTFDMLRELNERFVCKKR